jgi:hypothetical protein
MEVSSEVRVRNAHKKKAIPLNGLDMSMNPHILGVAGDDGIFRLYHLQWIFTLGLI